MEESLENTVEQFKIYLEKQGRSAKTLTSYACSVSMFISLCGELTVENLKRYREYLLKNYQLNTVNTRIYGMNRYLDYLQESGRLPASLTLPSGGPPDWQEPIHLNPVKITRDGVYRMQPVKEQKKSYLDTVISQRDYERMKRRLKQDGNMVFCHPVSWCNRRPGK